MHTIHITLQGPINVCRPLPLWPQGRLDNMLFSTSIWSDNETGQVSSGECLNFVPQSEVTTAHRESLKSTWSTIGLTC